MEGEARLTSLLGGDTFPSLPRGLRLNKIVGDCKLKYGEGVDNKMTSGPIRACFPIRQFCIRRVLNHGDVVFFEVETQAPRVLSRVECRYSDISISLPPTHAIPAPGLSGLQIYPYPL
ncbi:hypothetical protein CEXT_295681 [Caerostris extrusa]|uniref:Uncharacterized protein n=1 Tax=Caerostris extrusa TaxID=172846 RepID=A0AAV4M582_CAEEX|nr:hypothetical protein CEXT_295681 [Caerostris extrusa]